MTSALDRLTAALADRYTIERELGQGGMARVFLARDLRHEREVAIKVLRPALADAEGITRFLREIRTIAGLRHPHILPLFDSGSVPDTGMDSGQEPPVLYYVMPRIEGESLRARIDREPRLPLEEAIRLVREIASALAHAHGRGVIHRDIKPANILLDDGHALLADFGIAHVSRRDDVRLTGTGQSLGTPTYMSPEQVNGVADVDARSDLYSLACVAFEMLAGQPPFTGGTTERLIYQHLMEIPPSIATLRPGVPAAVATALARALSKSPGDRFASIMDFAHALDRVALAAPDLKSVAVLPFANLSADPDNEYFADGITDDITAQLSKIGSLKIVSRTSTMAFKNHQQSIAEVAARLQVGAIIEGSVRRAGTRVRIVAQLIDVAADRHLWAETFDRDLTDIFAIQAEVALKIASALRAHLTTEERARIARPPTVVMEAYHLFLQGRAESVRYTGDGFRKAVALFERAIALDPSYAAAHSALAQVYTELGETGEMPSEEALPRAKAAASRAVLLDGQLAEAHCMMGYVLMVYEFDWPGAEAEFRRALELNPSSADALDLYGRYSAALERFDDAITMQLRAHELDPVINKSDLATALLRGGRFAEAIERASFASTLDPEDPRARCTLGWALLGAGRVEEGLAQIEQAVASAPNHPLWLGQLSQALALHGQTERAEEILRLLIEKSATSYVSPYHLAYAYTGLGRHEEAIDCLELAFERRSGAIYGIKGSFLFRPLHSHPRFMALLRKMRLA